MSASDSSQLSPIHADVHHRIELLRERLSLVDADQSLMHLWGGFRDSVENILQEHGGMAEELLCVYEQLGMVFDVTRRLSTVQNETDMISLLVESLQHSFSRAQVVAVHPDGCQQALAPMKIGNACERDLALVERSRERQSVLTESFSPNSQPDNIVEAMVGVILSGKVYVCSILLKRGEDAPPFKASDMLLLESLTMFCGDLIRNHRMVRELREMSLAMVRSLVGAVDQKDEYTSGHSLRVGFYATMLGHALELNELDLQMLQWSALLHDVGKIGIRDSVLKKEGKLTLEEFDHIKEHPVRSHLVVKAIPQLNDALDGVLHHHERYDGQGYPLGLRGDAIPFQARIIQIADVFDALTSSRSYRPAFSWQEALDILRKEAGTVVDPKLQVLFDQLIRDRLQGEPSAWVDMVDEADHFMQFYGREGERSND